MKLKRLQDQVIVLTGATSGIGLVTARRAAREGAKLVLAARNAEALQQLADELNREGAAAVAVVADVGRVQDVQNIADAAMRRFGRVDTWVNNAGVSIYGKTDEVALDDMRQLFETNFWGVVQGSRVAIKHLRHEGGALINIGSVLSDRAIPMQGIYCASKFAVKGFTEALRMEVEHDGLPISVTLIKPSAIDTPYVQHAKNYMNVEPKNPPPVYDPEVVAEAILYAAEHPQRDVTVGGGGKAIASAGNVAPRLMDKVMEAVMFKQQRSDKPKRITTDALRNPGDDLRERGGYEGHVARSSMFTKAARHPLVTASVVLGAGLALGAAFTSKRKDGLGARDTANGEAGTGSSTDSSRNASEETRQVAATSETTESIGHA